MNPSEQIVTIRGTNAGLTLVIDDQCSFDTVKEVLRAKIALNSFKETEQLVTVKVQLGNRYLTDEQQKELAGIINHENNLVVDHFESNVITKSDALRLKEETELKKIYKIVRSGQVLNVIGDVLLVGDVNPGGKIVATGNIYVLGNLRGIAHAGYEDDRQAVIVASYMNPNQLRIADYISRAPDYDSPGVYMECAQIDESLNKIVIDRLQNLAALKNRLSGLERRMQNG